MGSVLAAVCFVFAILFAKGWAVSQSFPNSLALIAAGLLIPLIFGAMAWAPTLRPPTRNE